MSNRSIGTEHPHYTIESIGAAKALLFSWKPAPGLSARDFAAGIAEFADQCKAQHPTKAVIDARNLDQSSEAFQWLRGHVEPTDLDAYDPWWFKEIVPLYHDAGIASLAVATGDPNAPGELAEVPPGVKFKMGYFHDLDHALGW